MEKWLADRGKKLTSEDKQHSRVFLPYLIMDTAYQVYCKHIMTVPASAPSAAPAMPKSIDINAGDPDEDLPF